MTDTNKEQKEFDFGEVHTATNNEDFTYTFDTGITSTVDIGYNSAGLDLTMTGSNIEDYDWKLEPTDLDVVKERLKTIEDRLAILVPDPEKLEKWEALKEAYDHYKSLEGLIGNPKEEDEDDC
jgi:hypothetical protein